MAEDNLDLFAGMGLEPVNDSGVSETDDLDLFAGSPPPDTATKPDPAKLARKVALLKELAQKDEGSFMAFIEPLLTLGSAIPAEIGSGIAGIAGGVLPGPEGQAADWQKATQEAMTYAPKTAGGQKTLGEMGELMEPVGEAFTGLEKGLGDFAFDLTGSPALAAAAASAPTAALELLGLAGLKSLKQGTKLLDDAGRPTAVLRKELDKVGLDFDTLTPEVKQAIPQAVDPSLLPGGNPIRPEVQKMIASEIEAGSTADALAGLKLDDYGNIVADTAAAKTIKQGFTPGLVQAIKQSSGTTKAGMQQMLRKMKGIKRNERLAMSTRPTDVVGDSVKKRIDFVREKVNTANKQLNEIAETNLPGKQIDTGVVTDALGEALDNIGVELTDDLKPNFAGSDIKLDKAAQRAVKDVIELLAESEAPDALRAHKVKRQLDGLIDYKKAKSQLTPKGERVVKAVRRALNDAVRAVDPEYAQLNDILSDGLGALGDFNDAIGRKNDILDVSANKAIGQELRKLMSNYGNRIVLDDSLSQLDNVAKKFGGQFDDDVRMLSMFANDLDRRFGTVAKSSLQGTLEAAQNNRLANIAAESTVSPKTGAIKGTIELGKRASAKLKGVNDNNAFEAMDNLLNKRD